MNAQTKLSAKGQIVIPKPLRERLNWSAGEELEVIETAGGVLLRRKGPSRKRISVDEFLASVPPYDGPPVSIEEMDEAILKEAAARYGRKIGRASE